MYINRRLLKLAKGHANAISGMIFWYSCSAMCDAVRLASWAWLLICIIHGRAWRYSALALLGIVFFTLSRRWVEHSLVKYDSREGGAWKQSLRKMLFEKLFFLGPQFTDMKLCGELVSTVQQQTEWLKFYCINYLSLSVSILLVGLGFAVYGFTMSAGIGAAVVLSVMGVLLAAPAFYGVIQRKSEQEWMENNRFYSDCMDGLRGISTLKAFNMNDSQRKRIDMQAERLRCATMRNLLVTTLNTQVVQLCASLGLYLPVVIGAYSLARGTMAWEQLLVLFTVSHALADHCRRILGMWLRASKGISGIASIYEILDAQAPYSLTGDAKKTIPAVPGDVRFEDVSFSYSEGGQQILRNIHLVMKQGTQTVLVGSSGSGKSTLARLLFGFYKPQNGIVRVGDMPIDASTAYSIQDRITAIWQDCHIFHASCFDNILLAKPDASRDEVYEAAKRANIHDMIVSLPEGYDTVIGSGGMSFSGGEKQRIAIARAFLRNSPILILDEATSSLDRKNEAEIQDCIRELSVGKTVLIIAHRLDTIRQADQICVMENGCIAEQGRHDELMMLHGRYHRLMSAGDHMGGEKCAK